MIPAPWIYLVVLFVVPAIGNPIPRDGALVLTAGTGSLFVLQLNLQNFFLEYDKVYYVEKITILRLLSRECQINGNTVLEYVRVLTKLKTIFPNVLELQREPSPSEQDGVSDQPKIEYMHILSDIEIRFARTLVTSRMRNPARKSQETSFEVVLPENAFISGFVMEIDRVLYSADAQEKQAAKETYEKAVVQGKAAAHVSFRSSNLFNVTVNIPPEKEVTFNLTYVELLERHADSKYHHVVNISTQQVVPDMKVRVHIIEPLALRDIGHTMELDAIPCRQRSTNSSSPSCSPPDRSNRPRWSVNLSNLSEKETEIVFVPSKEQKEQISNQGGFKGQFEVTYDVERDPRAVQIEKALKIAKITIKLATKNCKARILALCRKEEEETGTTGPPCGCRIFRII